MFDPDDPDMPRILTADDVDPPPARESRSAGDVAQSLKNYLATEQPPGVFTGIVPVDGLIGAGLQPSDMAIIAADTGVGKSILGFQIATYNAGLGLGRVLYVSAEMTAESLAMRYVTSLTEVPVSRQRAGLKALTDSDWAGGVSLYNTGPRRLSINEALDRFAALDLEILDSGDFGISDLEREVKSSVNPRLVCIDYAQLIDSDTKSSSQAEAMKEISKRLRGLAYRRCVILAMAQINRAVEGRSDKELRLSDIAETGSLAKDSSLVVMLEREVLGNNRNLATLRLRKNRHAEPTTLQLHFNAARLIFERQK